jgi:predicted metalloprotease
VTSPESLDDDDHIGTVGTFLFKLQNPTINAEHGELAEIESTRLRGFCELAAKRCPS